MAVFKTLVILILAAAIFGTAGYFVYELYVKPGKLDQEEKVAAEALHAAPTPPVDYSLPAYRAAERLWQEGRTEEATKALTEFLEQYPDSVSVPDAKKALGQINSNRVFSTGIAEGKISYTVVKGDALAKIAGKLKTNAELIMRSNNLESINLQVGQQLLIPQMDLKILINRKRNTLTLLDHGKFFKEYPLISLKIPASPAPGPVQTKVNDKVALKGAGRVAFGSKDYASSDRWVMLSLGGIVIRGMPDPAVPGGSPPPVPPGAIVTKAEIEEIFMLVSRGTPVTIE